MKPAINQHNYEEFFLLYVDNELSAADKQAVEQFVQANPDFAVELEMLKQMQLPAEDIPFDEKDGLYRNESEGINLANYEEQFLLYVDNELSDAERTKTETFVLQHPSVQESFTLLKQAKLESESIVFANKEILYRKEERRIFYMNWRRIAVAAALIGLVVLVWNVLPTGKKIQRDLASVNNNTGTSAVPQNNNAGPNKVDNMPVINHDQPVAGNTAVTGQANINGKANIQLVRNNSKTDINPVLLQNPVAVKPVEIKKQDIIASVSHNDFPKSAATTESVSGDNATVENATLTRVALVPDPANSPSIVQPAVYKELDTDTEDEKKSLLLGSLEINKDKLRGFFRKASNLFRSKSKTEEEKTETRTPSSDPHR